MPEKPDHHPDKERFDDEKPQKGSPAPDIIKISLSPGTSENHAKRKLSQTDLPETSGNTDHAEKKIKIDTASTLTAPNLESAASEKKDYLQNTNTLSDTSNRLPSPDSLKRMVLSILDASSINKRKYQGNDKEDAMQKRRKISTQMTSEGATSPTEQAEKTHQNQDVSLEPELDPFSGPLFESLDETAKTFLREGPKDIAAFLKSSTENPLERVNYALSLLTANSEETLKESLTRRQSALQEVKEGKGSYPLADLVNILEEESSEYQKLTGKCQEQIEKLTGLINTEIAKMEEIYKQKKGEMSSTEDRENTEHIKTDEDVTSNPHTHEDYNKAKDKVLALLHTHEDYDKAKDKVLALLHTREHYNKAKEKAQDLQESTKQDLAALYNNGEILWRENTIAFLLDMEDRLKEYNSNKNLLHTRELRERSFGVIENMLYYLVPEDYPTTVVTKKDRKMPNTIATDINTAKLSPDPSPKDTMAKNLSSYKSREIDAYKHQQNSHKRGLEVSKQAISEQEYKSQNMVRRLTFLRTCTEYLDQSSPEDDNIKDQKRLIHLVRKNLLTQSQGLLQEHETLLSNATRQVDRLEKITTQHECSRKLVEIFLSRLEIPDTETEQNMKKNTYLEMLTEYNKAGKIQKDVITRFHSDFSRQKEEYKNLKEALEKEKKLFFSDGDTVPENKETQEKRHKDNRQGIVRMLESDIYKQLVTNFSDLHKIMVDGTKPPQPLKEILLKKPLTRAEVAKTLADRARYWREENKALAERKEKLEQQLIQEATRALTRYMSGVTDIVPYRPNSKIFASLDSEAKHMIANGWKIISAPLLEITERSQKNAQRLIIFDKKYSIATKTLLSTQQEKWDTTKRNLESGDIIYPRESIEKLLKKDREYYSIEYDETEKEITSIQISITENRKLIKTIQNAIRSLRISITDEQNNRSLPHQISAREKTLQTRLELLQKNLEHSGNEIKSKRSQLHIYNSRKRILASIETSHENTDKMLIDIDKNPDEGLVWLEKITDRIKEMDKIVKDSENITENNINTDESKVTIGKASRIVIALRKMDMRPINDISTSEDFLTSFSERSRSTIDFEGEYVEEMNRKSMLFSRQVNQSSIIGEYQYVDGFIKSKYSLPQHSIDTFISNYTKHLEKLKILSLRIHTIYHLFHSTAARTDVFGHEQVKYQNSMYTLHEFLKARVQIEFHYEETSYRNFLFTDRNQLQNHLGFVRQRWLANTLITFFSKLLPFNILGELDAYSEEFGLKRELYFQGELEKFLMRSEPLLQKIEECVKQTDQEIFEFQQKLSPGYSPINDPKSSEIARSILESEEYKEITKKLAQTRQQKTQSAQEASDLSQRAFLLLEKYIPIEGL